MEEIVVSAPGKLILHGEHAVVYGKVALAASLNLRTFLRLKTRDDGNVTINLPDIDVSEKWSADSIKALCPLLPSCKINDPQPATEDFINKLKEFAEIDQNSSQTTQLAIIAFLYLYCSIAGQDGSFPSVDVKLCSNLPVGAGLGSSAGYSVCLAACLLQLCGYIQKPQGGAEGIWSDAEKAIINSWAFLGEKIIHGTPSGIDNSVSTYGGAIRFQGGKISPLQKMPRLRILLINTKVPKSTKDLVARVRQRYNKYQDVMQPLFDSTEAIANKYQDSLSETEGTVSEEQYKLFEDLIDINQHLLGAMGVSHPSLENIIQETAKYGLHSKLTGAGGGGCAFTLLRPDTPSDKISSIQRELESMGYDSWETRVGTVGIIQHFDFNGGYSTPRDFL